MAIIDSAEAGVKASRLGATVVQIRNPGLSTGELEKETGRLVKAVSQPVVVSSRIDVALAAGAAGVNLPEHDLSVVEARRLLPRGLIGRSVHSLEAALRAEQEGADYVIFGSIFETESHPGHPGKGLPALEAATSALAIPVLAVGGVTGERIAACHRAGAAGFAAVRHFAPPV
jgi:thiamine-phosphate diphosphorylase